MAAGGARKERHATGRGGWLRAAVLGANDGILSTASLIVGVAASAGARGDILIAGVSGLVAGAMSMAAGEYVSVSSQADSEQADLARERIELLEDAPGERAELAAIYMKRGLDRGLAAEVAAQLMDHDALAAHARDELGITPSSRAQPIQAAMSSGASFSAGAALPLAMAALLPRPWLVAGVAMASLALLALLGAAGAKAGGAEMLKPTARVLFWGALAMAVTIGIGSLLGTRI